MSNKAFKPEQVTASIAMTVAQFYQLEVEVSETMSDGYSPLEALKEWDIIDEEFIQILIEEDEENHQAYLDSMRETCDLLDEELPF